MLPFQTLQKNLVKLKNGGLESIIQSSVEKDKEEAIELNTQSQLFNKGIDANGKRIKPAYAKTTISIKKRKGQPTNRVTLKDTGDFYDDTDLDAGKKDFVMINFNEKFPKLIDKYGGAIMGLTEQSKAQFSVALKSTILKQIKRKI